MSSDPPRLTEAHLERLPIFPLPRVVFLPDTSLPLHVFEPRYRELTAFCIENDWPMAISMIQPGYEGEHLERPPFASVAGIGVLRRHRKLPDGRYLIRLQGVGRVWLAERDSPTSYRVGRAKLLTDRAPTDDAIVAQELDAMTGCLAQLRSAWPEVGRRLEEVRTSAGDAAALSNRIGALVFTDPYERQRLLECRDVTDRIQRVTRRLSEILLRRLTGPQAIQ